jgi:hypothetical protein
VPDIFVEVDVSMGTVRVGGEARENAVREAVERAGFTWVGAAPAA